MWVVVLGFGLVVHQSFYLVRDGWRAYTSSFVTISGLRLGRPLHIGLQALGIPLTVALLAIGREPARIAAVAVYAAWLLIQNYRASNHLMLVLVGLVVLAADSPERWPADIRLVLAGLYLTAGLAKCNGQFMLTRFSASRVIVSDYLVRTAGPRIADRAAPFLRLTPWAVAASEIAVGGLLLAGVGTRVALLLAAGMHLLFGLTGNFPFSLIVLGLWYVALDVPPVSPARTPAVVAIAALGAVLGAVAGAHWLFPGERLGRAVNGLLTAVFVAAVGWAAIPDPGRPATPAAVAVGLIAAFFALNAVLVLIGVKSEGAFIMFSNIGPYRPIRFLGVLPRWRAAYYTVEWDAAGPTIISGFVPEHIVTRLSRNHRSLVSAPLAAAIAKHAATLGRPVRISRYAGFDPAAAPDARLPRRGPILVAPLIDSNPGAPYLG